MKWRAEPGDQLRFQTLPVNLLLVPVSLVVHLLAGMVLGIADAWTEWRKDLQVFITIFFRR